MAKEVLKSHDPACANRQKSVATEIMRYSYTDIVLLKMQCKVDVILDAINDEHRKNLTATNKANGELGSEDLVEVLFRLKESSELDFPKTNDNIIAVIFDMFSAGTESSSSTLDWAMAELIKNPRVMLKAKNEIRQAYNGRKTINEADMHMLKYLKLVVKETLHLHPPVSIIPRTCREECEIGGYQIPINANVIVNIWSIGRDPNYWENPDSFKPAS
ncbi:premnaspirodiene oxygenase-like [Olea europaea subsp. europaea]|uniref:Premnaspirodiene oxygenase-like n=1 Tax=Olea europaea subsp. europaea TaxID=158383 RepID=A0A8S0TP24_OLEEU|nr:premnaspirodiene oxygenase-like [Olea europaea subsp. europaea]